MSKTAIIITSLLLFANPVFASVSMPYILSDGMVVQRNTPLKLWGKATPGEKVTAIVSEFDKPVSCTTDSSGKWELSLDSLPAGGPYTIKVNDKEIRNVLSGDVFLCSGQSNMELPVNRVMDMFAEEVSNYENPNIRQFLVPQVTSFHGPLADTSEATWKECTQKNVQNFSALAYFFAKKLNEETGLPVGIINSSWGGTPVEAWISEETISNWPEKLAQKKIYEDDSYRTRYKNLEGENYYHWNTELDCSDPGLTSNQKWYAKELSDNEWDKVDLINDRWGTKTQNGVTRPVTGSHWLRKHITLIPEQCRGDAFLRLGCIEGADSAYVNGNFVGTIGYQYPPRIYPVSDGLLQPGDNVIAVRVISGNGEPKMVPEKPYKLIAGNGEEINLEGEWCYKTGAPMPKGPDMIFWHYTPVVLYDAMISPLFNYPLEGVVWYQGESNVGNREIYPELLSSMMQDWREGFRNEGLPFYIVELADFLHPSDIGGRRAWAEMREQQAKTVDGDPNATLIKNSDLGEWNDIHPLDKKTVGIRTAEAVLKNYK